MTASASAQVFVSLWISAGGWLMYGFTCVYVCERTLKHLYVCGGERGSYFHQKCKNNF